MYSKKVVTVVSLLLAFIVFFCSNFVLGKIKDNSLEATVNAEEIQESKETEEIKERTAERIDIIKTEETEKWQIEIPSISLIAPIAEGTDLDILNEYVGHFKTTQKLEGNIGLAAHNRGYTINYFKDLKNLKSGDKIIYTYGEIRRTYKVILNIQISDVDWTYLENTSENKLTLITCIENKPEYRRCVQAIEID